MDKIAGQEACQLFIEQEIEVGLSEGKTKFTAILIVGPVNDYCPPCGACRQLLYDYAPDIDIIMTDGKKIKSVPLSELLPFAFEETKLRKK